MVHNIEESVFYQRQSCSIVVLPQFVSLLLPIFICIHIRVCTETRLNFFIRTSLMCCSLDQGRHFQLPRAPHSTFIFIQRYSMRHCSTSHLSIRNFHILCFFMHGAPEKYQPVLLSLDMVLIHQRDHDYCTYLEANSVLFITVNSFFFAKAISDPYGCLV